LRALWLTAEPPDRSLGGGNIRQAHLLEALSSRFEVELVVVGAVRDEAVRKAMASTREFAAPPPVHYPSRSLRRLADLRRAFLQRGPAERIDHRRHRQSLDLALAGRERAALVTVEHAGLAPLIRHRRPREPWVITLQNVASVRARQEASVAAGGRQAWLLRRDAAKAERYERWIGNVYDRVFVVSEDDAADLPGPASVVPNGVDLGKFTASPVPSEPLVVLTGTLGYLPNVDGAKWLVQEVWPAVRAAVPAARLELVGRDPVPEVRDLARADGISVHADVPDTAPYLRRARVAVVPLRVGSGTRLKALEALASGRPVVGTTIGLAGLGLRSGIDAVVADDAAAFAKALIGLLQDSDEATRLARSGRAVAERFSWSAIGDRYAAELYDLAVAAASS
jgi:polysaccharide biosynthesis protein PslH